MTVSGGLGSGAPALGYAYDDAGRLTTVTKGGTNYATGAYDTGGRLATVTRYNAGVAGAGTTYGYDNADRITGLTTAQGGTTLGDFGYAYARDGQVSQAVEAIGGTSRTVGYTYDGLNRLVAASAPGGNAYAYAYDLAGNRTSVAVNGGTPATTSYDAADQVAGWTYDAAGNLLSDGAQTYAYDPLGRLASATVGSATTTNGYDGDHTLAVQTAGSTTTRYLVDTQGGLSERLGAFATTGGTTASTWYARGFGGRLARETAAGTAWYLADRLGGVRAEHGATAASLGVRTDYDPFGQPEGGPRLVAPANHDFTGEHRAARLARGGAHRPASRAALPQGTVAADTRPGGGRAIGDGGGRLSGIFSQCHAWWHRRTYGAPPIGLSVQAAHRSHPTELLAEQSSA